MHFGQQAKFNTDVAQRKYLSLRFLCAIPLMGF